LVSSAFPITRALATELEQLGAPVVLYKTGRYQDKPLNIRLDQLHLRAFSSLETKLIDAGLIKSVPGLPEHAAYTLIGASAVDRTVLACHLDPFAYLSHLSAMEFHGLTDRLPEQLYLSAPAGTLWTNFAQERMRKDLGDEWFDYHQAGLPELRRIGFEKLQQRPVHRYESIHQGAFRHLKDSGLRIATVGRTFLDMLREPRLCGGIQHVLDVYRASARQNLRLILDELDQHGSPIEKVRAGFVLEDLCALRDPRIDAWTQHAARGGSRKLDPGSEYAPKFSERWALSINVPGIDPAS
jgi:predicted transcriptional regulator of viral defense system